MPNKTLIFLFIFFIALLFSVNLVKAQDATPTDQPTCDLCGWCNPAFNPKPPNWDQCHTCLYDLNGNEQKGTYYTVLGCLSTKPEFFVKSILSIVFGVSGGIAFLAVLAGSATVLTSSGDPERLRNGKDMIFSSIVGILLILFSVFLLHFVGFDIFRIPGFS